MHEQRVARVRASVAETGADAILVTRLSNIRYLTGFTGSLAYLVLGESATLFVDGRYATQVAEEVGGVDVEILDSSMSVWPAVVDRVGALGSVAVEGDTLTASQHAALSERAKTVLTQGLVERHRQVKDEGEIAALREAVRLTDLVLDDLPKRIEEGMTELQLAGEIELLQYLHGGTASASPIIACSGPRTALPHGLPTARRIRRGEPVMVDIGTVVGGYGADTTRMFHLGPPESRFRAIYEVVHEAQRVGTEAVAAGRTGRAVDAAARAVIEEAGFGPMFNHSLGHSIGLDYHERPLLSPRDETVLEAGMVVTVEPGVYVEGYGGVRIEDMVVVTEDGCENLTSATRELVEL